MGCRRHPPTEIGFRQDFQLRAKKNCGRASSRPQSDQSPHDKSDGPESSRRKPETTNSQMPRNKEEYRLKHCCCFCDMEKPANKLRNLKEEHCLWFNNVTFQKNVTQKICFECMWQFGKIYIEKNPEFIVHYPQYKTFFHISADDSDNVIPPSPENVEMGTQTPTKVQMAVNPRIIQRSEENAPKSSSNAQVISNSRLSFSPLQTDNRTYLVEKKQISSLMSLIPCQTCGVLQSAPQFFDENYGGSFRAEMQCDCCKSTLKFHSSSFLSGGSCKMGQLSVVSEILAGNTFKSYKGFSFSFLRNY